MDIKNKCIELLRRNITNIGLDLPEILKEVQPEHYTLVAKTISLYKRIIIEIKTNNKKQIFNFYKDLEFLNFIIELHKELTSETLLLPIVEEHKKPKKTRTLYILSGLPYSGKSTYHKENIKGAFILSLDDCVYEIASKYNITYNECYKYHIKEANNLFKDKNKLALESNKDVLIDGTNCSIKSRKSRMSYFNEGFHKKIIQFIVSKEVVSERVKKRDRFVSDKIIYNMGIQFETASILEADEVVYDFQLIP